MKKLAIFLILMAFVFAGSAYAAFTGPGSMEVDNVSSAKKSRDDTRVTLEGYIVKQVADNIYIFRDHTGQISVEIDNEIWRGQKVDPDTKVRITGEVDKDSLGVEIDVRVLEVIEK